VGPVLRGSTWREGCVRGCRRGRRGIGGLWLKGILGIELLYTIIVSEGNDFSCIYYFGYDSQSMN